MAQNRWFFSLVVKKVAQSVENLLIMRFDGSVSDNPNFDAVIRTNSLFKKKTVSTVLTEL